jgi:hypothetical protein
MKKIALFLGLLMIVALTQSNKPISQDNPAAKIEFEKLVHDYGTIEKGSDGNCVFKYKNTGDDVLLISRVQKSCGCTTPVFSREPLMPGETAEIKVGYNTQIVAPFNKTITVFSNAENSPVVLRIKGTVVNKTE